MTCADSCAAATTAAPVIVHLKADAMMSQALRRVCFVAGVLFALADAVPASEPVTTLRLPELTILGKNDPFTAFSVGMDEVSPTGPSAGDALEWVPGADVNSNGVLTPIVQYRGLFGNRLNVLIDGVYTNSACPNEMEPPLHYVSIPRVDSVELHRGIAPVSSGLETLGTTVTATTRDLDFGVDDSFRLAADISGIYHDADSGYSLGGLFGLVNERHRLQIGGSRDEGDDLRFGDGTIDTTAYERSIFEIGYGLQTARHSLDLGYVRNETGNSGTPSLPMDIRFVDTDIARGTYVAQLGARSLTLELSDSVVDHRMDNFSLRPPLNPQRRRFSLAESRSTSYKLSLLNPWRTGDLELGVDSNFARNDADIFSPDNPDFFVNNFSRVERNRFGGYAEWRGSLGGPWSSELGLRYTRVTSRAGPVDGTPARQPGGVQVLRDRFNAADRERTDNNVDAVVQLGLQARPNLELELGVARKTRAPSFQERYIWLPLESTAGLADGKRYVGDVTLDSEVSYQLELGAEWRRSNVYAAPRLFYRRVQDYIQGTPAQDPVVITVSTANGDPAPLIFSNVEAEFAGFDMPWAVRLTTNLQLEGVINYVRGQRRDIDDEIFRVAPLNAVTAVRYQRRTWALSIEAVTYADQDRVSDTNQEEPSSGYELVNLAWQWEFPNRGNQGGRLELGIDNLFDRTYRPHLNGINRVRDSDVALGERVPGAGRNIYARVNLRL